MSDRLPDLLDAILERIPVRVFWKDRDGRYLGCNGAFARDAGLNDPQSIVGLDDFELGWRAQAERYRADDRAVMESGVPRLGYLEPQTTPDGSTIWLRTSKVPLTDGDGRLTGILGIYDDVSAQVRTEAALRDSERRFRDLFERSPDAGWIIDDTGHFSLANVSAARLLGFARPEELVGLHPGQVSPPAQPDGRPSMEKAAEMIAAAHARGVHRFDWVHRRADGHDIPVEITLSHLELDGRVVLVGFGRDITDRIAQAAALLESRRLHEEAQRIGRLGHWRLDHTTGALDWSAETFRLFGVDRAQFGASYAAFLAAVHPDDRAALDRVYQDAIAQRTDYEIEHRLVQPDGQVRWVHERCETTYAPDGCALVSTGTVADITDRKQAEAQAAQLRAQLEATQRLESIGRLAGGIAHDFNNMLGVILGRVALAQERDGLDPEVRADLREIQDAAERSAALTRQLLMFARRDAGHPVEFDLDARVDGLLPMLSRLVGPRISLTWRPGTSGARVRMDASQVDQILTNLCVNARDAIAGSGHIRIETSRQRPDPASSGEIEAGGPFVRLTVTDDGCGMEPEVVSKLFQPFFTTKGVGEGTGLGLATVYGIVTGQGGRVEVDSSPGQGSTFRVFLPVLDETAPVFPAGDTRKPATPPTVLLVDDDPSMLRLVRLMLERLGMTVSAHGSPAEAVRSAMAHRGDVDLLIADVVMPEMSGLELADALRPAHPGLRVVFMSGHPPAVLAPYGVLDSGAVFMAKPFTLATLSQTVVRALATRDAKTATR
jgi:PAS domain S-box-containing protein